MSSYRDSDVRRLTAARQAAIAAEARIVTAVEALRAAGAPWSIIGEALGVSKQAAQQRYGKPN